MIYRKIIRDSTSSEIYDKKYLLSDDVDGYKEFKAGELSFTKSKQAEILGVTKGMKVLEIGFGRGEVLRQLAKTGAKLYGIDYSKAAVSIAKETLLQFRNVKLLLADSRKLPFRNKYFDRVFCGDVIEHMSFRDAALSVKEMKRVLKSNGYSLIHTSPNNFFIKIIYPLIKLFLKFIYPDVYERFEKTIRLRSKVHVCEYNYFTLLHLAKVAGLKKFKVWIDPDILRSGKYKHTKRLYANSVVKIFSSLGNFWIFRLFLGNDLYLEF
jgi:ubiquinone/menaquinone biosynthesis C-methylase UbiE